MGRKRKQPSALFSEQFAAWLGAESYLWRPATLNNYRDMFEYVYRPALGPAPLADILPQHLTAMLAARHYAASTWRLHRAVLSSFFSWAQRNRMVPDNPARGIRLPRGRPRSHCLSVEEAAALLRAAREWGRPDALNLAAFGLYTGLRRRNIFMLRPERVRRGTVSFTAEEMKNHLPLTVPIHPCLLPLVPALPIGLCQTSIHTVMHRLQARADLPRFRFHDLRHTFASWLGERAPEAVVAALMGHSRERSQTAHYTEVSLGRMREALLTLPLLLD